MLASATTSRPRSRCDRATRHPTIRPFVWAGRRMTARWARQAAPGDEDVQADADRMYITLADTVPWPRHPVLRVHLAGYLLSGVALYRALQAHDWPALDAADAVADVLATAVGARRHVLERLARRRGFFVYLALATRLGTRIVFPAPGWRVHWREVSRRRIAFDIDRCYYLTTLTQLGAPELTPRYCRGDDLLYTDLSPELAWRRTGTLATGCDHCDFRYLRTSA